MAKFRILIADDHPAIRKNLRFLLESHADWEVSGEAQNGREAVEESARLRPDLVITDVDMPELNGLETIRRIRARDPKSSIIVLTMHDVPELETQLRKAGAATVVVKSEAPERLVAAVRDVQRRRGWLGGAIVPRPRHAITFFGTKAEEDAVLLPFIREGLERGERIVHVVEILEGNNGSDGIDRETFASFARGNGGFAGDALIDQVAAVFRESGTRGYPLTRLIGDTAWMMEHTPHFVDLELRYNALLKDFDDVVVCAYDVRRFSAAMMLEGLRAHPLVMVGGAFQRNPLYAE